MTPKPPLAKEHWDAKRDDIQKHFGRTTFRCWFEQLIPHADDGETLTLAAPSRFYKDWVDRNFRDALERVVGRKVRVVFMAYAKARAMEKRAS